MRLKRDYSLARKDCQLLLFFSLLLSNITFAQSPGGVSGNLVLWLKADAGTTLVSGDVSNWTDQSVEGNNGAQGTISARPTFVDNDVNFNPTLNFDGNDFISIPYDATLGMNDITVLWVSDVDGSDGSFRASWSFRGFNAGGYIHYVDGFNDEHAFWNGQGFVPYNEDASGDVRTGDYELLTATGDFNAGNTDKILYRQGLEIMPSVTRTHAANDAFANIYIGAGCNDCGPPNFFWDGDIAEVIVYAGVLTAQEQREVESYLAIKYGQTLGTTASTIDYKDSDNNTIWTGSATYQNDIAGIGRDDNSGLDQRKSLSENSDGRVTMALVDNGGTFAAPNTATADRSFLIWGNDNGSLAEQTTETPSSIYRRIGREWTVSESGTMGNVAVAFDTSGLGLSGGDIFAYALLVDTDNDFTSGVTAYRATSISGGEIFFEDVDFSDGDIFTFATIPVSPGGVVSNLQVWFKADEGTSTTTDNAAVASWTDQTTNGFVASDNDELSSPLFQENEINYNPVLEFDGAADGLNLGSDYLFSTNDGVHIFGLVKPDANASSKDQQRIVDFGFYSSNGYGISYGSENWNFYSHSSEIEVGTHSRGTETTLFDFEIDFNSTMNLHLEGLLVDTDAIATTQLTATEINEGSTHTTNDGPVTIGRQSKDDLLLTNDDGRLFDGKIGEIIFFDEDISDTDVLKVESYLAIKWGLTLGTTASSLDYKDSDNNTIWTASGTYQNDIGAIGRDDKSGLAQTKSISQNDDAIVTMALVDQGGSFDTPDAFDADQEFLIWGNTNDDDGEIEAQTSEKPADIYSRLDREWRVEETGTVGNVVVRFNLNEVRLPGSATADFVLLVDTDNNGNFSDGAPTQVAATSITTTEIFFTVDFADGNIFTLGSTAPTPGGVGDHLTLWLASEDSVTTVAGAVSSWKNKVFGSNVDEFAQGTAASRPVLTDDVINGYPYIEFDGTDDFLDNENVTGSDLFDPTDNGIFMVAKHENGNVFFKWEDAQAGFNRMGFEETGGTLRFDYGSDGNQIVGSETIDDIDRILVGTSTAAQTEIRIDGVQDQTGVPAGGFDPSATDTMRIGGNTPPVTGLRSQIDFAEIVVYDRELTANEKTQVESYMAIKYGITLGSTANTVSYRNSDEAVIWTGSGTYQNDIAGIGRDDKADQDQRKSRSINSDGVITMALADQGGDFETPDAFDADQEFLIWGNDNGSFSEQQAELPSRVTSRIGREWFLDESGTIGEVSLSLDTNGLGLSSGSNSELVLMIDPANSDFSAGAITYSVADSISGGVAYFNEVDFPDGSFFTFGTAIYGPGGVTSNLDLWVRADEEVFTDFGVTAATNGADVQQWNGGIAGFNATQSTGAQKPIYVTDGLNFNPVIRFDETNTENLELHDFASEIITKTNTLFSVVNANAANRDFILFASDQANDGLSNGTENTYEMQFAIRNDFRAEITIQDGLVATYEQVVSDNLGYNEPRVVTSTFDAGNTTFIDQNTISPNSTSTPTSTVIPDTLLIGGHSNIGSFDDRFFDGDIGEIITYSEVLSSTDQLKVQSYLAIKYGITLGNTTNTSDYKDSDNNTIWTASGTYQNDVAGIGRDDISRLSQTKSTSVSSDALVTIALMDQGGDFETPDAFDADQEFLIWGNDNASTAEQSTETPSSVFRRIGREWTVAETGTIGGLAVAFDTTGLGLTSTTFTDVRLLISDDNDFNTITDNILPDSVNAGVIYFNNVDFTDGDFFTFGSFPTAPGGVSTSLTTWLKADLGVTLAGSTVTNWENQQVGGIDEVTNVGTPELVTGVINNNPVVQFDGANDYMLKNGIDRADMIDWSFNTVFTAVHVKSGVVIAKIEENTTTNRFGLEANGGVCRFDFPTDAGANQAFSTTTLADGFVILTAKSTNTNDSIFVNSQFEGESTGGVLNENAGNFSFSIGAGNTGTFKSESDLAEIIVYDGVMSNESRSRVESYLAIKYGTTLGSKSSVYNYIASDTTTIWVGDTLYQKNIAGIGRDDASGLSQLQSTSQNSDDTVMVTMKVASVGTDKNFIVWGTDGFDSQYIDTLNNTPTGVDRRIARRWKVRETGDVTIDSLMIDLSLVPNNIDSIDLVLLLDDDGNFGDADTTTSGRKFRTADNMLIFTNINFDNDTAAYFSIGTLDESNTPLPVTFLKFQAELNEQEHVDLDWTTAVELNNDYFTTEHSNDGLHWGAIDTISGAGNSNEPISYHAKDEHPYHGVNYYRIKQTDFDRNYSYSEVRVVEYLQEINWTLYPNPTDGLVTIEFDREVDNSGFKVTNQLGIKQYAKLRKIDAQTFELDLSDLPAATYFITTAFEQDTHVEQVMKR